jgi:uncharacterized protein
MSMEMRFDVPGQLVAVSAILDQPPDAWLLYVMAHGAGAGMRHPFLESMSRGLAERGVATFRYQFPYMEAGRRRPDPPGLLETTVRAAIDKAGAEVPGLPVVAGGKSLGGRMTSQAASEAPLRRVVGLAFLGFPLHPPGRPGTNRAAHLDRVDVPMLFLQGTRDQFADLDLIRPVCRDLGTRATLHLIEGGDHSFKMHRGSGRTSADMIAELCDTLTSWARSLIAEKVRA